MALLTDRAQGLRTYKGAPLFGSAKEMAPDSHGPSQNHLAHLGAE